MSKIEACPCDADALQVESDFLGDTYEVKCGACGMEGGIGSTEASAWASWNKSMRAGRVVPASSDEASP